MILGQVLLLLYEYGTHMALRSQENLHPNTKIGATLEGDRAFVAWIDIILQEVSGPDRF